MAVRLTEGELEQLDKYVCNDEGSSLVDPIMQKIWWAIAHRLPITWCPNIISFAGLAANIITTCVIMVYAMDAQTETPWWCYALCSAGILFYQTADAMDGKQSLRTGMVSPLGELVDHGCDCISTVFIGMGVCSALLCGLDPWNMMFFMFSLSTLFYLSHCQVYVGGRLRFSKIDVTEAQFGGMIIHLMSAVYGPSYWNTEIPELGKSYRTAVLVGCFIPAFFFIRTNMKGMITRKGFSKTRDGTSVLYLPAPLLLVQCLYGLTAMLSPSLFLDNIGLFVISCGIAMAKVTIRLIVSHITFHPLALCDWGTLGPLALFIIQIAGILPHQVALIISLVWNILDLLRYIIPVTNQICEHIGLYFFTATSFPKNSPFPKKITKKLG